MKILQLTTSVNQDLPILFFPNQPQPLVILSMKHLNYFSTSLHIVFDSIRSVLKTVQNISE